MLRPSRTRLALPSILAALALLAPAAAGAATVPPGNSAANQYTEAFPTAGGDRDVYAERDEATPNDVLGARNAKRLAEEGEEGRAVAELAAETAPAVVVIEEADGGGERPAQSAPPEDEAGQPDLAALELAAAEVEGSSGLGETAGQALGFSGGGIGLFLPILILATALWAAGYAARRMRGPADGA